MKLIIKTIDGDRDLESIKDGTIIINRGNHIDMSIDDLLFKVKFIEPNESEQPPVKAEIKEIPNTEDKFLQLSILVNSNTLSSIFCPPVKIGSKTNNENGSTVDYYLSFNVRPLDGDTSHCIKFDYSFFASR